MLAKGKTPKNGQRKETDFQNMKTSMEKVTEECLFTISHKMGKKEKCNKIIKQNI